MQRRASGRPDPDGRGLPEPIRAGSGRGASRADRPGVRADEPRGPRADLDRPAPRRAIRRHDRSADPEMRPSWGLLMRTAVSFGSIALALVAVATGGAASTSSF